jgi:ketosteroid isomerase-like protein
MAQTIESDIRKRIAELVQAIGAMDIEDVMSIYARDILSFDIEPPLEQVGAHAKRKNWLGVFDQYEPSMGYEVYGLKISAAGDVAFSTSLNRIRGVMKNGGKADRWVRSTLCWRKREGNWLIVSDHVSVPTDMASGKACVDLEP